MLGEHNRSWRQRSQEAQENLRPSVLNRHPHRTPNKVKKLFLDHSGLKTRDWPLYSLWVREHQAVNPRQESEMEGNNPIHYHLYVEVMHKIQLTLAPFLSAKFCNPWGQKEGNSDNEVYKCPKNLTGSRDKRMVTPEVHPPSSMCSHLSCILWSQKPYSINIVFSWINRPPPTSGRRLLVLAYALGRKWASKRPEASVYHSALPWGISHPILQAWRERLSQETPIRPKSQCLLKTLNWVVRGEHLGVEFQPPSL